MKIRYFILMVLAVAVTAGCGPSYDDLKKMSQAEQAKLRHEDSLALKIGVLPTLDCLPIYVAKDCGLFDSTKADIRLKPFNSQIDGDQALVDGRLEGCVTDIVRGQRMKAKRGVSLDYVAATNAGWQLISNRLARIKRINQLDDKMIAITRFSATALLADLATDSAKLKDETVFKIQINDVALRLQMLLNNEMDAVLLPEPQATEARMKGGNVIADSRDKKKVLGVLAFRAEVMKDSHRRKQLSVFGKAYNMACDSLNKNGLQHYSAVLKKHYGIDDKVIKALPKIKYTHMKKPSKAETDNIVL